MQGLDQQAAIVVQQAVALDDPVGQLPVLGQALAELQQWHAEQVALDLDGRFTCAQYASFPVGEQLRVAGQQRPQRREE
ncbi:hypothetical protein D9M69_712750 [compost metagenome]